MRHCKIRSGHLLQFAILGIPMIAFTTHLQVFLERNIHMRENILVLVWLRELWIVLLDGKLLTDVAH